MINDINNEGRLVKQTFATQPANVLVSNSVYAYNAESFGPSGTLGRANETGLWLAA